jgi:transposase
VAEIPRIACPTHGTRQVKVPWAGARSRFTALFECLVIEWLQQASIKGVAEVLDMSWDQVAGIMARAVDRGLGRRELTVPKVVGVDETSFQKRHEYVTVVCDPEQATVLFVSDGRSAASLSGFFDGVPRHY